MSIQEKTLAFLRKVTFVGVFIGLSLLFYSFFFAEGIASQYAMHSGIGFLVSTVFIFIIGSFFTVLEDVTQSRLQEQKQNS